jgi:hypothetical protein
MAEGFGKSVGQAVAAMLTGSWRRSSPELKQSAAEIEEIAPALLVSGAAPLCWRRVRHSTLQTTPAAKEFHRAYRLSALQAALHQRTIERAVTLLRERGIEAILVKGWAVARLYPELALRPYADLDLCVRPQQYNAAEAAINDLARERNEVDLHCGFAKFGGGSVDGFYDRSQLVKLGETPVRVLCAEDHLRVLSLHLLREGAWRPLWLCDVARMVESRGANFNWDICLTGNRRHADWIICAIGAAHQLLGAQVDDIPAAHRLKALPRWLVPTILKEWESQLPSMSQRHRAPMWSYLRRPAGIFGGLRHRWPNPIEATVSMRASFNELPRLPFQLGNCLARTARFALAQSGLSRGARLWIKDS